MEINQIIKSAEIEKELREKTEKSLAEEIRGREQLLRENNNLQKELEAVKAEKAKMCSGCCDKETKKVCGCIGVSRDELLKGM